MGDGARGRWLEVEPDMGWQVAPEGIGGVYVFLDKYGAVYVGSSENLPKRLAGYSIRRSFTKGYITPWGQFSSLRLKIKLSERAGDWLMWEYRLIDRLQPRCNRRGVAEENQADYGRHHIHLSPRFALPPDTWKVHLQRIPREDIA